MMTNEIIDEDNKTLTPTAEFEQAERLGKYSYPATMRRGEYNYCRLLKASCMDLKMAKIKTDELLDEIEEKNKRLVKLKQARDKLAEKMSQSHIMSDYQPTKENWITWSECELYREEVQKIEENKL